MNERLDHELLEELKLLMEDDFCSLLETYLRDSERQFFEVSEAWERGDLERLRRSAHSLRGASSNIGAVELASLCTSLEQIAAEALPELVPDALAVLKTELWEVRDAVEMVRNAH